MDGKIQEKSKVEKGLRITAAADIHGHLPDMCPCDLAVICGDIFPWEMDREPQEQGVWFRDIFLPWVEEIESELVILIAGNHDHWIEANNCELLKEFAPSAGRKLVYLCNSGMEFRGLQIYGTPWVPPPVRNKAFSMAEERLRDVYALIPQRLDLLLTHTVPNGCNGLDVSEHEQSIWGSSELRRAIEMRQIDCLIGGHIHMSKETMTRWDNGNHQTVLFNVACCDNQKKPLRKPIEICL